MSSLPPNVTKPVPTRPKRERNLRVLPAPTVETGAAERVGFRRREYLCALLGSDLLALAISYVCAFSIAGSFGERPGVGAPAAGVVAMLAGSALVWIAFFGAYRLYDNQPRRMSPATVDEVSHLFHALLAGSLVLLVAGEVVERIAGWHIYAPSTALLFIAFAVLAVPTIRGSVRMWVLPRVLPSRRVLIVGGGEVGQLVRRKLESHREYRMEFAGFIEDDPRVQDDVVGRTAHLTRRVDELEVDWVILTSTGSSYEETLERVRAVRRNDVHLSIVPDYYELFSSNALMEDIEGVPVVSLPPLRFSRSTLALKRSFDIAFSALGLLALAPVLAVVAAMIKLDSRGPVFFRQTREGRGGRQFDIVKFRTMFDGAEAQRHAMAHLNEMEGAGPLFKMREDPRVTRVGAVLRKLSIDELPQLWNVLKGEMSLVGPRPFVVHESERITGWAGRRLDTTPGITGLWQVLGRNDIPFDEMVKLDYVYVTNWSLWWDIKILFQTIPVVLGGRGAY
jgi:exopolysaccharide biosynthesis polyprenyl glycosylphosphotransferase